MHRHPGAQGRGHPTAWAGGRPAVQGAAPPAEDARRTQATLGWRPEGGSGVAKALGSPVVTCTSSCRGTVTAPLIDPIISPQSGEVRRWKAGPAGRRRPSPRARSQRTQAAGLRAAAALAPKRRWSTGHPKPRWRLVRPSCSCHHLWGSPPTLLGPSSPHLPPPWGRGRSAESGASLLLEGTPRCSADLVPGLPARTGALPAAGAPAPPRRPAGSLPRARAPQGGQAPSPPSQSNSPSLQERGQKQPEELREGEN